MRSHGSTIHVWERLGEELLSVGRVSVCQDTQSPFNQVTSMVAMEACFKFSFYCFVLDELRASSSKGPVLLESKKMFVCNND